MFNSVFAAIARRLSALLVVAVLAVGLIAAAGCATLAPLADEAIVTAAEWLGIVKAEVKSFNDKGFLSPVAWEAFQKYWTLGENWTEEQKAGLIEWLSKYLDGSFALPSAEWPEGYPADMRPPRDAILQASAGFAKSGGLTAGELETLKKAGS